jgi:predicted KAP-like P-loop ATPase
MFDADRPITSIQQDRLGRGVFAKYLARCILDHKTPESLVIGLQGGWGSGKTSLINLTLEELNYAASNMFDNEKPIILNFSPWSYSGQGQIIYGFFRRLSSVIRQFAYLENSAEIIHLLELYASFFTHKEIPPSLRAKRGFLTRLTHKEEAFAWGSGRDPIQIKTELNELLKQRKHKIIIIIDNISRLETTEINQIFQIVKSMGDYANTVYLLSFDKTQVLKAINHLHEGEGHHYLDKLVQLPFSVPAISKQDLENLLFDRLQNVIQELPEESWDASYWADIYYSGLKYFFNSCRDITRYVNTLSFSFAHVKEVVNPIDFFALAAIEVFTPQVLYGIRDNKDLFSDLFDKVYQPDAEQLRKDRERCDAILQKNKSIPQPIMLQLLQLLFPRLRSLYSPEEVYYHSESLARERRRICSPDMFDVYFRLSIPRGYMAETELDIILSLTDNAEKFDQALSRLNQDNRITRFLDLLDSTAIQKISPDNIGNVINALFDSGDLFPEGKSNFLSYDIPTRIHRICHQLLHCLSTTEKRFKLYKEAIKKANKSIYIIIHELIHQSHQHLESEDTFLPLQHRDFTPLQLAQLKELAVEKIALWARIGRLVEHPKLLPILYAWQEWDKEEACKRFVELIINDNKGLLAFLSAALKRPIEQAIAKQEKDPQWKKYLENITHFIAISSVEPKAKAIFEDENFETLQEEEQLAVLIFLNLIDAQTIKTIPDTAVYKAFL